MERQHKIEELKSETDLKDVEIAELKQAADERKKEMESIKAELEAECADKDREISELKEETNSKDTEIAELKEAADERKKEMESIKAELEAECADKDREIAELKDETNTKDTEIAALKVTCNEREEIVIRLDGGLKAHIAAAAAREQTIAGLEKDCAALSARLDLLSSLPADAASWAQNLHDKDVHIGNIEAIVKNREELIAQLRQVVENYEKGYGGTEQAKHYGRLLAEKEAVIQELNRACVERGAVIAQLAASTTGPTAFLHKLLDGLLGAHSRQGHAPRRQMAFPPIGRDLLDEDRDSPAVRTEADRLGHAPGEAGMGQSRNPAKDWHRDTQLRPAGLLGEHDAQHPEPGIRAPPLCRAGRAAPPTPAPKSSPAIRQNSPTGRPSPTRDRPTPSGRASPTSRRSSGRTT